jgi:hypothetical protein
MVKFENHKSENLSLIFDTEDQGGSYFWAGRLCRPKKRLPKEAGVHPNALSFFAGPNCLPKSEAGLHHCLQQAKVKALPRIKFYWTGRDWAISHPLDNPQK